MTRDVNTAFARALVDEWVRAGLAHAALAPGSRSTPLALALAAHPQVRVEVFLDERSAGFFALGAARASGRPAVVASTSGTAAAHFHAAVLEARHSRVPLVVCTADRPPELRDTGAPQTTDQVKLYGDAVRFFADVAPEDHPAALAAWRPLAARAWTEAAGPPAGPVHLNVAFREPLVPDGSEVPEVPGRAVHSLPGAPASERTDAAPPAPWTATGPGRLVPGGDELDRLAETVTGAGRGLLVAGWGSGCSFATLERFAAVAGWPVLADPLSGLRQPSPQVVSTYDTLLRIPGFAAGHRPDLVVRLGGPLTSKAAVAWLGAAVPQVLVDPDGAWLDPARAARWRVQADPEAVLDALAAHLEGQPERGPSRRRDTPEAREWLEGWQRAERTARASVDAFLDASEEPFEGRVARDVAGCLPAGATLVVASSMPVRDLEAFARPREGLRVLANRGVNGIDGFTSTVLGTAAGSTGGPVAGLMGDLAFLHDAAGLTFAARRHLDAVLVVVDNDGGGIFSFLPQAAAPAVAAGDFEALFGTPHGLDLVALARTYGVPAERVEGAGDVAPALTKAVAAGGIRVVVVATGDRSANVARHREAWAAVAAALEPGSF